ncbi:esterase [Acinetobacter sp. B5B]|uniref:YqiA/YcfP family alpha/beta fold hydrolase n=1 Tax=Acinetobacter baretiae TaxID=2605383 RepID=UPI0018C24CDB|nr:YqiA/YcfP family alpha/beta fold hydrolase [Acinetobacter baretiae]MBF7682746.1 esterase [Acinetobacter baretiae]MBF7684978.1 esterase [Acinetobacter baretiae]
MKIQPTKTAKILFLHGLDSSKASKKFDAIACEHKYCIDVDYRHLSFQTVFDLYVNTIRTIKPNLLIGHGIGGYWALKMSYFFKLPAIIANPSLKPRFRTDYIDIQDHDLEHDIPQLAYIELNDEVLNMHETKTILEQFMFIKAYSGGYHRLQYPENINPLIDFFKENYGMDNIQIA